MLLVLLACESLYYANGSENFLNHRDNFAFLLAYFARGLLDSARIGVDHREQHWHYGERNQGKVPVDVKHHGHHAHQSQAVDQHSQQSRNDEAVSRVDVAGYAAEQVASLLMIVIGE